MGVDISTYRCRVGQFVPHHGTGVICLPMNFSQLIKIIGVVSFIRTLLIMAGVEENPGPDTFNFRYQYLLIEIGTTVLREIFDRLIGHDFVTYLANNSTASQTLTLLMTGKNRKITADQEKLLPPIEKHPKSSMYDITLLTCLLRNICGLSPAGDQVWMNPLPTDYSIEADITRLRKCRNALVHADTLRLSEAELNDKWTELEEILNRLNSKAGIGNLAKLLSEAKCMAIDEELKERYLETIEAWFTMDCKLEKLQEDISELKHGQSEIQEDVDTIQEVEVLKRGQFERHTRVGAVEMLPKRKQFDIKDMKIFQLRSQLIRLGTAVLQKIFDYRVGNDFANYLTSNKSEETKLHWLIDTNRITKLQVKLLPMYGQKTPSSYDKKAEKTLIPPSAQTPSSSSEKTFSSLISTNFDISLLTVLLRYVCGLRAPNHLVWKKQPEDTDMSIEADINRLGLFRNRFMKLNHPDEEDVDTLWKELLEIHKRLGRGVGIKDSRLWATEDAEFDNYLDDLHIQMLEEWFANDQRNITLEQKDAQTCFFKDSDDDAWTIDEENVSSLLSQGKLPNAKQLKKNCEKFGSTSRTVQKVCAYICNTIQMTKSCIRQCWPAYVYDKKNETDTNLVTFVVVKDIEDKLNIDQKFGYNIHVYELFHGSRSAETSEMRKRDIENADSSDHKKVDECVNNNSFSLLRAHSNITLIEGSTVKSIGYMSEKEIIKKPCVAIYVHKKGYIPLGEKPFPTQLDGFDTDVRECVVSLFRNEKAYEHHDNLLMGTSIRNSNKSGAGTLGGFVEHPKGLLGLTCCHVLCSEYLNHIPGVKKWSDGDPIIEVEQPNSDEGTKIGKVVHTILRQDTLVGIDIALFCIEERKPNSGQFAVDTPADFSANDYNSGTIMRHGGIKIDAGCIKYGSETGRTKATLSGMTSTVVTEHVTLLGQLSVKREQEHFAVPGDSGALVFVEDKNELTAIGVVVAGDQDKIYLTPLGDTLDALNEHNTEQFRMKQFNNADCEPMEQ